MRTAALRHWMRDGSVELALGFAWMVAGVVTFLGRLVVPSSPDWVWLLQLLVLSLVAVQLGMKRARHRLGPAAGYVEPYSRAGAMGFGLAMGLAFATILVLLKLGMPRYASDPVVLLGACLGVGELVVGATTRLPRPLVVGAATLVLTFWLTLGSVASGLAIFMLGMGGLSLIAGALANQGFRSRRAGDDPRPDEDRYAGDA